MVGKPNIKLIEGRWYVIFWKPITGLFNTVAKFVGKDVSSVPTIGERPYHFKDVLGETKRYPKDQISQYEFIEIKHVDHMFEYISLFRT